MHLGGSDCKVLEVEWNVLSGLRSDESWSKHFSYCQTVTLMTEMVYHSPFSHASLLP